MIGILSPAKTLDTTPVDLALPVHGLRFEEDTRVLLGVARRLSPAKLSELMGISDALATLNHERFQSLSLPLEAGRNDALPAALLFDGDVYKGLDARSLTEDELRWADGHLAILSGLYGLLRPLDLAAPYRLEMGTRLKTRRGDDLYAFWGPRLARQLDAWLADHDERVIVNLASREYDRAVDRSALKASWVDVSFKEVRDGTPRIVSFFAKRARGTMARFLVRNRVDRVEGLKDFAEDGYAFAPDLSSATHLVFTR